MPEIEGKKWEDSSNVAEAHYSHHHRELLVLFTDGARYLYKAVPADVWKGLCESPSPGSFLWRNVRKEYQSIKLNPEEMPADFLDNIHQNGKEEHSG